MPADGVAYKMRLGFVNSDLLNKGLAQRRGWKKLIKPINIQFKQVQVPHAKLLDVNARKLKPTRLTVQILF